MDQGVGVVGVGEGVEVGDGGTCVLEAVAVGWGVLVGDDVKEGV